MSIAHTISDTLFRLYRIAGRTIISHSTNKRPGSRPYVSGDGFREMAHHVFDNLSTIDAAQVKDNDIVFVGDSKIDSFLQNIHPAINAKYVLITHNGDAVVNEERFLQAESKIIRWYGINVVYTHPKIVPIPLGIENKHLFVCGIPAVFNWVRRQNKPKVNKIFYGFTVSTNTAERQPALDIISKHPDAETLQSWRGFFAYLHILSSYKLVLSPPGSSTEGHRTWDTLYVGGVPIVKSSPTTDYFKKIGVPLLVVSDWSELNALNQSNIDHIYTTVQNDSVANTLWLDYWQKLITSHDA